MIAPWVWLWANVLIGLSYATISLTLLWLVWCGRGIIPFRGIFLAFGLFIVLCGAGHLAVVWSPAAWLPVAIHVGTAIVSVVTAAVLPGQVPRILCFVRSAADGERRRVQLQAAMQANRLKSEFLATVSHELRTPLTAVVGYGELLADELFGPVTEEQRDALERIQASSRHLVAMIDDILDLAKAEAGTIESVRSVVDVHVLAQEAVAFLAPSALAKGVHMHLQSDGKGLVQAEPRRIRQILLNVIGNAVKFTPAGGFVTTRVVCHEAEVVVIVEDTGIGLGPEHLQRIFDPFWQADQAHTRAAGGTGLGLAIVKQLVDLFGGTITARSVSGRGTTFTIAFPTALPEASGDACAA